MWSVRFQLKFNNMSHNFLEVQPGNDRANRWRNIFSGFLFLLLIGAGGALYVSPEGLVVFFERSEKLSFPTIEEKVPVQGGDLVVSPPKPVIPDLIGEMVSADVFSASAMIVKDHQTGAVLFEKNAYTERPIASITKLMSELVLLEKNLNMSATTTVVGVDSLGTHMYAGDVYTLLELWDAASIGSSNKAILSLAHAIDWPVEAFVERMNQKARELGMMSTRFTDPTGLDDTDVSTASDVVLLLREALRNEQMKQSLQKKELTLYSTQRNREHHMWSTNWLLLGWISHDFAVIHGGKTGYIPASLYNFSVVVEDDFGHMLDVVVLGAESHEARFTEARDIAQWVFTNYKWAE
jgi:serine-type D-Ala-D-Ala carboxypeptidase (penicillin-binding protein 5/6)